MSANIEPSAYLQAGSRAAAGGPQVTEAMPQVDPAARAEAVRRLVERIQTFVRSQRPGLTLTVAGGLNARVEVQRTGHNEVSLTIRGTRSVPRTEDLWRIRDELKRRGLHLAAMNVG